MLILKRRCGEEVIIDGDIRIKVLSIRPGHVSLGIQAPKETAVYREEVYARISQALPMKAVG